MSVPCTAKAVRPIPHQPLAGSETYDRNLCPHRTTDVLKMISFETDRVLRVNIIRQSQGL